jgi:hypothetical protein
MQGSPWNPVSPLRPVPDPDEPDKASPDDPLDEPEAPDLASVVERAYLIAVGVASLAATAVIDAIARSLNPEAPASDEDVPSPVLPVLAGAAFTVTAQAGAMAVQAGLAAIRTAGGVASATMDSVLGVGRSGWVEDRLAEVDDRGRRERADAEDAASAFTNALVPPIVDAVLDHIDLTAIVAERVDLDAVVASLDLNGVVDRVDLMRAVDRISIDEIAAKLDVDAVAARLDVQAVIDRLDLVAIAQGVVEGLNLSEIIRESTGAMSAEAVDGIRIRGMDADRLIAGVVDRILSRRRDDDAGPVGPGEDGA